MMSQPNFDDDESLEEVMVNELHFARAARELEELTRCVDWKKKEEEMNKDEGKEVHIIMRLLFVLFDFFHSCRSWNEELVKLIRSIVQVFRATKKNYGEMSIECIKLIRSAAESVSVKVEDLLKGGAINAVLEEIQRQTLNKGVAYECLQFFTNVSERLKRKTDDELEEEEEEEEFDEGDEERDDEKEEEKDGKKKEERRKRGSEKKGNKKRDF
ncbi:TSET complex, TPLATE subunit B [Monocercomonoides exilis]|uniref:TSET complex, TPLATE subunit B n=1 Tax=Monocercomonoides exilis TaxID=2049356 RepID=UPI0035595D88|nr:TSET complex, TPLATE subunit B [Monocercomonoides exilis]|eukprot:MONOS_14345.1-p1 / transcript=MONOS_14345.1 / gene=MONOS_14345 / organism=Monocercomonoides_exilis_PA203 / gene_product= TSET complex, TPLATE subunit B, putative / transcript_product= TSET complex, TPLATE subunit B, putative / location=Mono_scaffold00985:18873-19514(-) / protein_length=214 / sequence_SO=supercontig / SO=protein_coding / is_pseudo=false